MFLASDQKEQRERKIRHYLASDAGMSLVLAAVNFEWTVCRAVLFLSCSPNSKLRARMRKYCSLDDYKKLWQLEVVATIGRKPLAKVVRNWSSVRRAFDARNRLVHGRDRYTKNMAEPHIESLIKGVAYVDDYCKLLGYSLHDRMPIRR